MFGAICYPKRAVFEPRPQFYRFAVDWNAIFQNSQEQIPLNKLSVTALTSYMKNVLRRTDKSWLLIFDNAESFDAIKDSLPTIHWGDSKKKHIVITTQNCYNWENQIDLAAFTDDEALRYATFELRKEGPEFIRKIVDFSGNLPFHLGRNINYIKTHQMTIEDYLAKYKVSQTKEFKMSHNLISQGNYP